MKKHIPEGGIRCLEDAEQFLLATSSKRNSVSRLMKCLEDSPKPWRTKYWKEQRNAVIGNRCSSCKSREGPMVLQHKWHRLTLKEATTISILHFAREDGKDISIMTKEINCCPKCMYSVRYRKTTDDWACSSPMWKATHYIATKDLAKKKIQTETVHQLSKRISMEKDWYRRNKSAIDRLALKIVAEEAVKYWSMFRTTTECRRCAFLWDRRPDILLNDKNKTDQEKEALISSHPLFVNQRRMRMAIIDFPWKDL